MQVALPVPCAPQQAQQALALQKLLRSQQQEFREAAVAERQAPGRRQPLQQV